LGFSIESWVLPEGLRICLGFFKHLGFLLGFFTFHQKYIYLSGFGLNSLKKEFVVNFGPKKGEKRAKILKMRVDD